MEAVTQTDTSRRLCKKEDKMDLRQLRNRPESELARFKNQLKQMVQRLRYVSWVLFVGSLLISLGVLFVLLSA